MWSTRGLPTENSMASCGAVSDGDRDVTALEQDGSASGSIPPELVSCADGLVWILKEYIAAYYLA